MGWLSNVIGFLEQIFIGWKRNRTNEKLDDDLEDLKNAVDKARKENDTTDLEDHLRGGRDR